MKKYYDHQQDPYLKEIALKGNPRRVYDRTFYICSYYEKVIWRDYHRTTIIVCNCEKYPLIWMYWWFAIRLRKTLEIIDTALDYILQTWGAITPTPPNQSLPGVRERIKLALRKQVKGI
jgi:hypothetical protein